MKPKFTVGDRVAFRYQHEDRTGYIVKIWNCGIGFWAKIKIDKLHDYETEANLNFLTGLYALTKIEG